ncbi:MAG: RNA-binding S4 domain-containing protein [Faecalibacterium sp.]|nr:RNA-binding S4 domain-containing protein [Ruminococcus sp.]MCM1392407.1 RNA-binding S4 domain-containing protein [Ruminococcus sp.]MCM1486395.1 RNA-binding S4 domain-containing protein [Faecalibacterium sp.]
MKVVVKVPKKKRIPVFITTDYIRLDAALKLANVVGTGGQAKAVIQDELVKVNNEICSQRGKKLRDGDNFEFERVIYEVTK